MPRIIALDLGSANVKATVWNLAGRKATFVDRWIHPVPHGDSADTALERQLLALDAMLEEHPEARASSAMVCAAFGGAAVNLTKVELPFTDAKQVTTTLPFAVEEAVPFDIEDRVMSWRVLSREGTTRTLVALADEERLRQTIDALAARKVEPRRIYASSELLTRWEPPSDVQVLPTVLEGEADEGPKPASVVLDLGHTRTLLVAVRDGELLSTQSLDVAGADITRAIAEGLGCSWNNAERLKCGLPAEPDPEPVDEADGADAESPTDPGESADDDGTAPQPVVRLTPWDELPAPGIENLPAPVQAAVERVLARLLAQIRASLLGLEDSHGLEIERLILGGGTARLPGLAARLQEDLAVPVVWAAAAEGTGVPCEYLLADSAAQALSGQASALIDLRAGALRWRSGFDAMQAVTTYGTVLVLFFTIATGGLYAYKTWLFSSDIAEAQARIEETIRVTLGEDRRNTAEAMGAMRQRIDEATARASALSPGGVPPSIDIIYQISTTLPPPEELEIDVDVINFTGRNLTFDAEVPSYAAAETVELAFKGSKRFANCTKSNEQQRRGKILFTMTCPLTETPSDEG